MVSGNLPKGATSQTIGGVSEIAVMAPIRKGRIPNERRTYEERLRMTIANLAGRVKQGLPTELDKVPTIHFGRMIIIRPEQYLVYSAVRGVRYDHPADGHALQIPDAIDEYHAFSHGQSEAGSNATAHHANGGRPIFRSWLLTLVEFDGDLRTYFRDVAEFLGPDFDSVFRNCQDFPGTSNFEQFWAWIRRYQIETGLFYPRYRDLSVARIKQLQDFKRRFDAFVTKVRSPTGRRVESMDELFDEFLRKTQQYASDFPTPGGMYKPGED
ncbi:hypothetical protein RSO01_46330 [Reyranella soli]|jgi:hypothetical protein|uniref:Uncharacterized protein n=2 Tax=Reyranella soli TaxID=1230389 RepID=A0A512NET9_9HYPH|nr:hypothetical protein RSO01_46330 [Reyranella soli]